MFDNLKIISKKLNANFRITTYIPKDYDKNDIIYKAVYILCGTNPYQNPNYHLEEILDNKNAIGIAIYPNLDIAKNKMLYNTFEDKPGFAKLYEDFIINEIKPIINQKYRVNPNALNNVIIGINDTAILAYSLAHHYTNQFDKVLMYNLNTDSYHKLFMSDFKSKFDPNISFYYSMDNNKNSLEIESILTMFGSKDFKLLNKNITSLLELI